MKIATIILSFVMLLTITGCGVTEGVVSTAQKSYLYFTGNTSNIEVSIDNGNKFSVNGGSQNHYGLKPGKHNVQVFRNGSIIVNRTIFLGDEVAKEIEVR